MKTYPVFHKVYGEYGFYFLKKVYKTESLLNRIK